LADFSVGQQSCHCRWYLRVFGRTSVLLPSSRLENRSLIASAALEQAKRTLVSNESELGWRMQELSESVALTDSQKTEIESLTIEVEALKQRVQDARDELKSAQDSHRAAVQRVERVLVERESDLAEVRELSVKS
jgi:chromosome segregation ATPase